MTTTDTRRILESLIAQRKVCGGGRSDKADCHRRRCRRCKRGRDRVHPAAAASRASL